MMKGQKEWNGKMTEMEECEDDIDSLKNNLILHSLFDPYTIE